MTAFINHKRNSPELSKQLRGLKKTPGTCLFIDLVDSTAIKYEKGIEDWGRMINNTFHYLSFLKDVSSNIVKGIGDEIMIFIPDSILAEGKLLTSYHSVLNELCSTIYNIKNSPLSNDFYDCKMAIHYCEDVYNISFLEGFTDYYGKDIDLSARLMNKALANTVVVSEVYYQKVQKEISNSNLNQIDNFVETVSDIIEENFKGIPHPIEYRRLNI